jgi:hypothetical protein
MSVARVRSMRKMKIKMHVLYICVMNNCKGLVRDKYQSKEWKKFSKMIGYFKQKDILDFEYSSGLKYSEKSKFFISRRIILLMWNASYLCVIVVWQQKWSPYGIGCLSI